MTSRTPLIQARPTKSPEPAAIALGHPAVPSVAGRTVQALGTFCSVLVTEPSALRAAQDILSGELAAIDRACSRFRADSELSALNRAAGAPLAISPLFARALTVALRAAEITDGDIDPTCGASLARLGYDRDFAELDAITSELTEPPVPAAGWQVVRVNPAALTVQVPGGVMLDLGATAKALAADMAAEAIWRQLRCGVLVNLGGDLAVAGQAPGGGWKVGVDDGVTDKPVVSIVAGGIATSSAAVRTWRRGDQALHHILVPGSGKPASIYWAAVSVAGATCVDANTASTASMIRGRRAAAWLEDLGMPARLVRPDGHIITTAGWPQ